MPANVEIKAQVAGDRMDALATKAAQLSGTDGTVLEQEDTFFAVGRGRLKLRRENEHKAQLIFYERSDLLGPKLSDYSIAPVENPDQLKAVLAAALGVRGVVSKTRRLFLVDQTRVHVDRVLGLDGGFVELEVVLRDGQSTSDGEAVAAELMAQLGIGESQLICGAYVDLLLAK